MSEETDTIVVVPVRVEAGEASALVEIPRAALAKPLKMALFNRSGSRPYRYQSAAPWEQPWSTPNTQRCLPGTALVPFKNIHPVVRDGPDTWIFAVPAPLGHRESARRLGIVQARQVAAGAWRADFTPDSDEFVTDFVLGDEGGVQYGGRFTQPVPIWAGHRLVVGVSQHGEAKRKYPTRSIGGGHDAGSLSGGRALSGRGAGFDRRLDLDGRRLGDRHALPAHEGDAGGDDEVRGAVPRSEDRGKGGE